jgi:hypothetical protein
VAKASIFSSLLAADQAGLVANSIVRDTSRQCW